MQLHMNISYSDLRVLAWSSSLIRHSFQQHLLSLRTRHRMKQKIQALGIDINVFVQTKW